MLSGFFKKKINVSLPNFHNMVFLNLCFITLQKNNKEVFKDGFEISSADGCFYYSIWSRMRGRAYTSRHDIETTVNLYAKNNIPVFYVFDNESITKEDLYDNFSNLMLKTAHKKGNGVYAASELLCEYIRKKYPAYTVVKIASEADFGRKNILIHPKYNNLPVLENIKHKDSAYITLNPLCAPECRFYNEHFKYIEQEQLNFYSVSDIYLCPLKRDFNFYDLKEHSNFISEDKMLYYINKGFRNFRIDFPYIEKSIDINYSTYDAIEGCVYYLIKPEYRQEIRQLIIRKFAGKKKNE